MRGFWNSSRNVVVNSLQAGRKIVQPCISQPHHIPMLNANWLTYRCLSYPTFCTADTLTHWGRVTHICVSELTVIGSDNGLSPCRRQAIIWTNAEILLIWTLGTNFSEILGEINSFSLSKMHFKMSSAKWRLFGLGLNELMCTSDLLTKLQFGEHGSLLLTWLNSLRPRQDGRHFADNTFNRIFVNENVRISINISLKFVAKGPISTIPALVQIMAWRRPGDKPLSEPVMVSLLTHICVTRPQWVNWEQDMDK